MTHYDAIIVGGGHNGLICAAYLARRGMQTLVLERRPLLGGACVTEDIHGSPGYRVSTGAAQVGNLLPQIVADLNLAAFGYTLIAPDPLTVFPFPDGRHLALWQDTDRTLREIAAFSPADAKAFPAFYQDCVAFADVIEPLLYADDVPTLADIEAAFDRSGRSDLYGTFMSSSIREVLDSRFESDAVKGALGLTSTFGTNAGPDTPGTTYVMLHHMFGGAAGPKGRAVYVRGGMGGLAQALAGAAAKFGCTLRTDSEVAAVLVRDGAAWGVELSNGERVTARAVISNADPQRTFLGLVDGRHLSPSFVEAIRGVEMQGVALKVNCALDRLPRFSALAPGMNPARVSICPSLDYMAAAWTQARQGQLSTHPFMTVHMQSAIDDSLAPAGRHTLTCYAQYFPYRLDPALGGWDTLRTVAGDLVLRTVADYAPDLHDCITATEILTPLDLEDRFAMTGGHQNHGDLMPDRLFDRRPAPSCTGARTPIDRLYICGAGAHPGGCIWGAPGQRAARAVLSDTD